MRSPCIIRHSADPLAFIAPAQSGNVRHVETEPAGDIDHDGVPVRHAKDCHLRAEIIESHPKHGAKNGFRQPAPIRACTGQFNHAFFWVPIVEQDASHKPVVAHDRYGTIQVDAAGSPPDQARHEVASNRVLRRVAAVAGEDGFGQDTISPVAHVRSVRMISASSGMLAPLVT